MPERPYTQLSCVMSLDGYIDDASETRLLLSNAADLDQVDAVRAGCDAILVGAGTVRRDNPRLLVRSPERIAARLARGRPAGPIKVTVTQSTELDPGCRFFSRGDVDKLVYCPATVADRARSRLGAVATVIPSRGDRVDLTELSADLFARGVHRLMVEGGRSMHTQFLLDELADELRLAVAPFFIGDAKAARFLDTGRFPWPPGRPATLVSVDQLGNMAVLRYALSPRFDREGLG